ncbi:DUF4282 domain-containing protein [Tractidigestivibacter sp.]|uniref:DUF4282 domain-containing protein n=1 Tax=Tractidigestivibacter sp. TaxID=2847320 RepID=UPI002A91C4F9|nr:DUF4282 domain-containing protein [Tractidigestivibacter sp.]MDY5271337.1 DUF4282 domain-containing protein [Tractidigestivibacter sp.]
MRGYGHGYGSYGYGDFNISFNLQASNTTFAILLVIGFIAAIVISVVAYRKYACDGTDQRFSLKGSDAWRSFLRFDRLVIDRILRALYIFCATFTALFFLAVVLASLADDIVTFVIALLVCVILCLIAELVERMVFELVMLGVTVNRNVADIKGMLGDRPASQLPPSGPAPACPSDFVAAAAPVVEAAAQPEQAQPEVAPATPAPEPSSASDAAPVGAPACPTCGAPVEPGSHFCSECGVRLD